MSIDISMPNKGNTEVWYMKRELFRELNLRERDPDPSNLAATHVKLGCVEEECLEDVYVAMQGENWSPNGEANEFLRKKGVAHTSMSVGDVCVSKGVAYIVEREGFVPLNS